MASRLTVSRDTRFLAVTTAQNSPLDRAYAAIDRRLAKMSPEIVAKFNSDCDKMAEDYNKILGFVADYIKDTFSNPRYGLVSKMRHQGRLWSETNPEGITELYFRWAPRRDIMEEFGFLVDGKYQKPDAFHFHFNSLVNGGCWKKNRDGEEFFDNHLFLATFREERVSVPKGVSALAVLAKRVLTPSFIKVSDVSDKRKSEQEVWEIRFYYKEALKARRPTTHNSGGAGSGGSGSGGSGSGDAEDADSDAEAAVDDAEDADSDAEAAVDDAEDAEDADSDAEAAVDDAEDAEDADSDAEAAVDDAEDAEDADSDAEAAVDA
jgi:hypothetical protein